MPSTTLEKSGRGFALPAAIFLLVVLGGLAAWMMQLTVATQAQDALAIEGERAYRTAEAGLEAGIYAARTSGACATQTLTFSGQLSRFTASVTCTPYAADEGGLAVTHYRITSVACNQPAAGACPNTAPTLPEYAERQVRALVER
ncbi:MAG: agglutinin biogenesis protein MshP [Pseudomonadota bacterium]|nr:agglutinin biogenesis protein MshP [Pseudomonadota bacterium]